MSVDLLDEIFAREPDPKGFLIRPPYKGALEFKVADVRGLGFTIERNPIPGNPYHAQVRGQFTRGKITQLSQAAKWYVEIPDVSITGC